MTRSQQRKTGTALMLAVLMIASTLVATSLLGRTRAAGGTIRTYYVAADIVPWDFAPDGRNSITGRPFGDEENVFIRSWSWHRACVRQGTLPRIHGRLVHNAAAAVAAVAAPRTARPDGSSRGRRYRQIRVQEQHGLPAERAPARRFLRQELRGCGLRRRDVGRARADDMVQPGTTYTYVWHVPERAGPGSMDGSSVMWMYHSHVNEPSDTNAGLIGPIVVTKKGMARPDGSRWTLTESSWPSTR